MKLTSSDLTVYHRDSDKVWCTSSNATIHIRSGDASITVDGVQIPIYLEDETQIAFTFEVKDELDTTYWQPKGGGILGRSPTFQLEFYLTAQEGYAEGWYQIGRARIDYWSVNDGSVEGIGENWKGPYEKKPD